MARFLSLVSIGSGVSTRLLKVPTFRFFFQNAFLLFDLFVYYFDVSICVGYWLCIDELQVYKGSVKQVKLSDLVKQVKLQLLKISWPLFVT
jgi:hypothetical protein